LSSRQILEALERSVPGAITWVVSCFPRGSTQIIQPAKVPQSLLKSYVREFHVEDRATWQAITHHKPLTEHEAWAGIPGGFEQSRYYRDFMEPAEQRYVAAAPLANPLFPGYPGAIHVYRPADQGAFSAADLAHLARAARQYDQAIETSHHGWQGGRSSANWSWMRRPPARQFIFDGHLKPVLQDNGMNSLEERVREQMLRHARQVLSRIEGQGYSNDRVCFPDTRGDLWIFRAVAYARFPALGDGPFIFYCMQPECKEWAAIRPSDIQADNEIQRLVPAMQFMHREFGRGPTLNEISRTVDLSPFHFHRRFTELFGITPKHFALECQIHAAKTHMAAGDKTLVEIAQGCGFAHQSHFTSRFKQATGLTPTGWRRLTDELRPLR
jgi:AraC-like DNA-binding protein